MLSDETATSENWKNTLNWLKRYINLKINVFTEYAILYETKNNENYDTICSTSILRMFRIVKV